MTEKYEPTEGQIVPQGAYDALLSQPDKGPLVPLSEADPGLDEQPEDVTPAADPEPEGEPAAEPEPSAADAVAAALDRVNETNAKIAERLEQMGKAPATPEPKAAEPELPADVRTLLESDDPRDQALGRLMQDQMQQLAEVKARAEAAEAKVNDRELADMTAAMTKHVEAVGAVCNPPLTEAEKDAVVDWMTDTSKGPALAERLTFEMGVDAMLPGRRAVTTGKPAAGAPKGAPEGSRPAEPARPSAGKGTVIDRGGTTGPASPAERTPPANETIEQAIARGSRQLKLTR